MVNTTESDIVSPSVTTKDPLGFLGEEVFLCKDLVSLVTSASLKSCNEFLCSCTICCAYSISIQPFLTSCLNILVCSVSYKVFDLLFQTATDRTLCKKHTITELCVILEQRV